MRDQITIVEAGLVGYRPFTGNDRSCARQLTASCHVAHDHENADKGQELDAIGETGMRKDFPEEPQYRLRARDCPHRTVEVPALVTFTLC